MVYLVSVKDGCKKLLALAPNLSARKRIVCRVLSSQVIDQGPIKMRCATTLRKTTGSKCHVNEGKCMSVAVRLLGLIILPLLSL